MLYMNYNLLSWNKVGVVTFIKLCLAICKVLGKTLDELFGEE